ncbi:MAG: hypothetical protein NDP19_05530 [Crenarchaeota archaeon]|nr:hypothetical protein [Thermoproteota archaeon]
MPIIGKKSKCHKDIPVIWLKTRRNKVGTNLIEISFAVDCHPELSVIGLGKYFPSL